MVVSIITRPRSSTSVYIGGVYPEEMIRLAHQQLGLQEDDHYAPRIPPHKEAAMCAVHDLVPSVEEPVLVLYDDTLLGGARDGYIITPGQICWKNTFAAPRSISWRHLQEDEVVRSSDMVVKVLDAEPWVSSIGAMANRTAGLLRAIARESRGA